MAAISANPRGEIGPADPPESEKELLLLAAVVEVTEVLVVLNCKLALVKVV